MASSDNRSLDHWLRVCVCRVLLTVPALLSLAILEGCAGSGSVLRQFGVVGTFAEDCSKGIAEGGARAIYDAPPVGIPTFTAVNRYGTFRSKIVRADRVNADTLIMYTDDPGGAWNEIDIRKSGNGFLTTRMVSHKPDQYRPVVAIGDRGMSGDAGQGLYVEKCSDSPTSGGRQAAPG